MEGKKEGRSRGKRKKVSIIEKKKVSDFWEVFAILIIIQLVSGLASFRIGDL